MSYRKTSIFNGQHDHVKINIELQNLARAGFRTTIKFGKETAVQSEYLNLMALQISRATKINHGIHFDGKETSAKLNKLFLVTEKALSSPQRKVVVTLLPSGGSAPTPVVVPTGYGESEGGLSGDEYGE